MNIIYDINGQNNINIFGREFVENNKNICKMIIDDKEYEIRGQYNVNINNNDKLKIKLKGFNNITNMSFMFFDVHHYHLYLIFQNGILIMFLI